MHRTVTIVARERALALVKRLLRQTADNWHVRQYDPRRDFDLPKKKWPRAHVVAEVRRGGL